MPRFLTSKPPRLFRNSRNETRLLADVIYSMESTNTEFHAYQFKPVVKILNAASKGLLIADEVGLGKTIEAGLVWTELVARYDVQRLLVVCPKSLQEKWRIELSQKFGVRAQTVDARELLQTLKDHERTGEDFALVASCLPAAYARWSGGTSDLGLDDPDVERGQSTPGPLTSMLSSVCGDPSVLQALRTNDPKFDLLHQALQQTWATTPDEKIIVFSSFRGTIDYLSERLKALSVSCLKMHGSVKQDRNEILRQFRHTDGRAVLLTSEIGGEGLDLQFCRILINYDLPWNPMKVEQRIGRIDRIGQRSPSIEIASLICEGTIEEQIYRRLYERLGLIVQTLGAYEPILGDIVRELENRLLDPTLSSHEADAELDRQASAAEARRLQEEALESEAAGLIAHGDMILQRIQRTHEQQRWIQPFELYEYVAGVLRSLYPG